MIGHSRGLAATGGSNLLVPAGLFPQARSYPMIKGCSRRLEHHSIPSHGDASVRATSADHGCQMSRRPHPMSRYGGFHAGGVAGGDGDHRAADRLLMAGAGQGPEPPAAWLAGRTCASSGVAVHAYANRQQGRCSGISSPSSNPTPTSGVKGSGSDYVPWEQRECGPTPPRT